MWRARAVRLLLAVIASLAISIASVAAAEQLRIVTDAQAGIKIGIPESWPAEGKPTKWGHTWASRDGGMTVNSLAFAPGRSIEDVYAKLTSIKGRVLTENAGIANGQFVLRGRDGDGNGFYLAARVNSDIVRGFSTLYTEARRREYADAVGRIANSFEIITKPAEITLSRDTRADVVAQTGHGASINCMQLSGNSKILVTADIAGVLKLWSTKEHKLLATLPPPTPVEGVVYMWVSDSGRYIYANYFYNFDGYIEDTIAGVWDVVEKRYAPISRSDEHYAKLVAVVSDDAKLDLLWVNPLSSDPLTNYRIKTYHVDTRVSPLDIPPKLIPLDIGQKLKNFLNENAVQWASDRYRDAQWAGNSREAFLRLYVGFRAWCSLNLRSDEAKRQIQVRDGENVLAQGQSLYLASGRVLEFIGVIEFW